MSPRTAAPTRTPPRAAELCRRIERGRGLPSVQTLRTLATVLGASADYLLGLDDRARPVLPESVIAQARSLAEDLATYSRSPPKKGRRSPR